MSENAAIELHDSLLQGAVVSEGDVVLMLDAYVHRSAGTPGVDAGTGWRQSATILLRGFSGEIPAAMSIVAGCVLAAGREYENVIPAPLHVRGSSGVTLQGARGERTSLTGDALAVELLGDPTYVEAFPGGASLGR